MRMTEKQILFLEELVQILATGSESLIEAENQPVVADCEDTADECGSLEGGSNTLDLADEDDTHEGELNIDRFQYEMNWFWTGLPEYDEADLIEALCVEAKQHAESLSFTGNVQHLLEGIIHSDAFKKYCRDIQVLSIYIELLCHFLFTRESGFFNDIPSSTDRKARKVCTAIIIQVLRSKSSWPYLYRLDYDVLDKIVSHICDHEELPEGLLNRGVLPTWTEHARTGRTTNHGYNCLKRHNFEAIRGTRIWYYKMGLEEPELDMDELERFIESNYELATKILHDPDQ